MDGVVLRAAPFSVASVRLSQHYGWHSYRARNTCKQWYIAPEKPCLNQATVLPNLKIYNEFNKKHKQKHQGRTFTVIIERDAASYYVASIPELRGCHTQARSLDTLMRRIREAIELCLEVEEEAQSAGEFVGIQQIRI